jgi:hypothetical protein
VLEPAAGVGVQLPQPRQRRDGGGEALLDGLLEGVEVGVGQVGDGAQGGHFGSSWAAVRMRSAAMW